MLRPCCDHVKGACCLFYQHFFKFEFVYKLRRDSEYIHRASNSAASSTSESQLRQNIQNPYSEVIVSNIKMRIHNNMPMVNLPEFWNTTIFIFKCFFFNTIFSLLKLVFIHPGHVDDFHGFSCSSINSGAIIEFF